MHFKLSIVFKLRYNVVNIHWKMYGYVHNNCMFLRCFNRSGPFSQISSQILTFSTTSSICPHIIVETVPWPDTNAASALSANVLSCFNPSLLIKDYQEKKKYKIKDTDKTCQRQSYCDNSVSTYSCIEIRTPRFYWICRINSTICLAYILYSLDWN